MPAGTGQSESSTTTLSGVVRKSSSRIGSFWWVVFGTLLGPGTTTKVVSPGFPHTTEPLSGTCFKALWSVGGCLGGGVCGGVVV